MPVTNTESFSLTFEFRNQTTTAKCERFTVAGKTIVRVPLLHKNGFLKHVYIYYENVSDKKRFFRYPLPEPREDEAIQIELALHKQLSRRVVN